MFKFLKKQIQYNADSISVYFHSSFVPTKDWISHLLKNNLLGFDTSKTSFSFDFGRVRKAMYLSDTEFEKGVFCENTKAGYSLIFAKQGDGFPYVITWKFKCNLDISFIERFLQEVEFSSCFVFDDEDVSWQSEEYLDNYKSFDKPVKNLKVLNVNGEIRVDTSKHYGKLIQNRDFVFIPSSLMYFGSANKDFQINMVKGDHSQKEFVKFENFPLSYSGSNLRTIQKDILDKFHVQRQLKEYSKQEFIREKIYLKDLDSHSEEDIGMS